MPIRAENKDRYPKDWPEIRQAILARAVHRCEGCGVENHALILRGSHGAEPAWRYANDAAYVQSRHPETGEYLDGTCWDDFHQVTPGRVKVILTIAHLDHQPENCDPENLRAWCQRCHNAYDAPMRAKGVAERRRAGLAVSDMFGGGQC